MTRTHRYLTLTLLLLGLCRSLHAASPVWRWSNPKAHGNNVAAMAHRNGWIIQVAERGQIYVSRSLDDWMPRASGTTNALRSVTFFGDKVVITAENGLVLVAQSIEPIHRFQPIQLPTTDWLEGIANSSDLLVAVGDNGAVYTSRDAAAWQRQPQPFNTWLRSVAFGGGVFVAVGDDGFIASSADGVSWERRTNPATEHLNRVAWVHDRFLAVGESGRLLVSADAASWQTPASGTASQLNTVTGNSSTLLLAGNQELRVSENGPWVDEIRSVKAFPAPDWTYLSSLWDGTLFLVGGRSGRTVEGFKTNASANTIWVERRESLRNWIWDLTRTPEFYIAVGDRATVMTSETGVGWELELVPDSMTNAVFLGVGGSAGRYFAVGNKGSAITSTNGVVWDPLPLGTDNDLQGVADGHGLFVVTGGDGTILTSTDGVQWRIRPASTTAFLSSVVAFPGGFVATGSSGTILRSADGQSWSPATSGTTNWIYRVRHLNGQLIAVGQNGTILTSVDGQTWTPRSSGTVKWLNDVTRVGSSFFAVGTQGACLESPDAVQWDSIGTITEKSLFALATDGAQVVTAGVEGVILRAQIIPDLTPISIQRFSHASGENLFLFSGSPDQRFTLDRSPNLSRWSTGSELEFIDGATTLLHLETASALEKEFYRPTLK